jgi:hypothetical protein
MIACINTCKAQDSISTPKIVLEYLYKQDIKAQYLEKDTASLKEIIVSKDSIIDVCNSQIANRQKAIDIQNEQIGLQQVQIDVLSSEAKKERKKVILWKGITLITGLVGSISTVYFMVR